MRPTLLLAFVLGHGAAAAPPEACPWDEASYVQPASHPLPPEAFIGIDTGMTVPHIVRRLGPRPGTSGRDCTSWPGT